MFALMIRIAGTNIQISAVELSNNVAYKLAPFCTYTNVQCYSFRSLAMVAYTRKCSHIYHKLYICHPHANRLYFEKCARGSTEYGGYACGVQMVVNAWQYGV